MSAGILVVGMNHRTAPVALREQLAVPVDALDAVVRDVRALGGVSEAAVVATCNRVEIYAAGAEAETVSRAVRGYLDARAGAAVSPYLYEHRGEGAIRHAFRVCASLDSLVVGEPQILGQVKEAFAVARDSGTLGALLSRVLPRAFQTAKRVRSETGIANGQVSVASVAVDLARGIFGELKGRKVLVVGAGKMALGAARSLVRHGATLAIANRSYDKALELVREHGGAAHPLTDLSMLLGHSDVVVCSTAAQRFVLTPDDVSAAMKSRRGRALFLIDITVPRNIDPRVGDLDSVYLYNVDDLEKIVSEGQSGRSGAREAAERVVAEELTAFVREMAHQSAVPTITAMRERFRSIAVAEMDRSLGAKLKHLSDDDRKALGAMIEATVNKLMHPPTIALRAMAGTVEGESAESVVRALFALDAQSGAGGAQGVSENPKRPLSAVAGGESTSGESGPEALPR